MTKNTIRYIDDNKAQVTKTFKDQAHIFGTEQYKLWRAYRVDYPTAQMVTKSIKKNPDKKTTKNLTYENMKVYIKEQENAKTLLTELDKQIKLSKVQTSPYHHVFAWFNKTFEGYDSYKEFLVELAKKKPAEVASEEAA